MPLSMSTTLRLACLLVSQNPDYVSLPLIYVEGWNHYTYVFTKVNFPPNRTFIECFVQTDSGSNTSGDYLWNKRLDPDPTD